MEGDQTNLWKTNPKFSTFFVEINTFCGKMKLNFVPGNETTYLCMYKKFPTRAQNLLWETDNSFANDSCLPTQQLQKCQENNSNQLFVIVFNLKRRISILNFKRTVNYVFKNKGMIFLKYTQWQYIYGYDNSTAVYKILKTSHPCGIRTRDFPSCRRTRWPPSSAEYST
jgi:hypothetical protein